MRAGPQWSTAPSTRAFETAARVLPSREDDVDATVAPPVVKGRRDEFSGGRDILKAKGLKAAYAHFLSAGPPPAALNCDTELPGISTGFEIRQGRAMELAPLMEVRRSPPSTPPSSHARVARAF